MTANPGRTKQMQSNRATKTTRAFCRAAALAFNLEAVCVTRGADGCVLLFGNEFVAAAAPKVTVADTIGAGDAFCAALLHGIGLNWPANKNRAIRVWSRRSGRQPCRWNSTLASFRDRLYA